MSSLQNKTILIVDDEPDLRNILEMEFSFHGCKVIQAESGKSAFEILKNNPVDAVISDVRMPDGDGVSLLKNIREQNPKIPLVVLVTGFSEITEKQAEECGALKLLHKPVDLEALSKLVSEAIG